MDITENDKESNSTKYSESHSITENDKLIEENSISQSEESSENDEESTQSNVNKSDESSIGELYESNKNDDIKIYYSCNYKNINEYIVKLLNDNVTYLIGYIYDNNNKKQYDDTYNRVGLSFKILLKSKKKITNKIL